MNDITDQSITDIPPDQILATISPSAPRRAFGIIVLSSLGAILLYIGLAKPPAALHWQAFLLGLGGLTLYLAHALRKATAGRLELTTEELRESGGRVLARVETVVAVERGTFAIKPSNGFLLRLSEPHPDGNSWAPGLWWRLGRRIGVGGITSASEAKAVAEVLAMLAVARKTANQPQADEL